MISSERKLVSAAVGGRSVRACDNCVRRRARWYCAADDAFLCQSCDASVHSANPLARRHERVRLKIASNIKSESGSVPTWHQGFTRKARTPRGGKKHGGLKLASDDLVPEICSEDHEENEEQLLYRVPIFDPFVAELCNSNEAVNNNNNNIIQGFRNGSKSISDDHLGHEMNHLQGFLPSEMDLAEFAADVESLLGKGLEDESFDMEGLGILDCDDEREKEWSLGSERVKIEVEENGGLAADFIDMGRETDLELNLDYDSPITCEEEEDSKAQNVEPIVMMSNYEDPNKVMYDSKKIFLRLDYEGVISAWDDNKSPWMTGERPDLDSGESWPDCLVRIEHN